MNTMSMFTGQFRMKLISGFKHQYWHLEFRNSPNVTALMNSGVRPVSQSSWIPEFTHRSHRCTTQVPLRLHIHLRRCASATDKGDVIRQHNGDSGIYPTPRPSWVPEFIKRHSPYECRNSSTAATLLNSRFSLAHPGPQVLLFQLNVFTVALSWKFR